MPDVLRALRMAAVAMIVTAAGLTGAAAAPPAPEQVVESFHLGLLASMKAGGACVDRAKPLRSVVEADFDLPGIARQVMRRHWDKLDDAQRQRFTAALEDLVVNTYAKNFHAYDGQTFETRSSDDYGTGAKQVRTRMIRPGAAPVAFDYLLRDSGNGWRIANIVADGVSDLAVRSAQYDAVMKAEGLDTLVKKLQEQAAGCD